MRREPVLKIYLAALWLVCAYRAVTQSIVHDEGLTYELYLAGPAARMFDSFEANHHFLNTLLMKVSLSLFGLSEWSMRLPALAGAALYFAAVYRISIRQFRGAFLSLLVAALLTLNPLVLDFMVAARGYGMALGLLTWALAALLEYVQDPNAQTPRELMTAGAALALSVAANLIFVVPALVIAGLIPILSRKPQRAEEAPKPAVVSRKKARKKTAAALEPKTGARFWRYFMVPALGIGILFFITAPLQHASSAKFYSGAPTMVESLRDLATSSLAHSGPWRHDAIAARWWDVVAFGIVPAGLFGALLLGIQRRNTLLLLTSATLLGSALIWFGMHLVLEFPYPADRTGIYFIALIPLPLAGLAEAGLARSGLVKAGAVLVCAVGVVLLLQFLLQFQTQKFLVWEYDADTRRIVDLITQSVANKEMGSVRVYSSWQVVPSLKFYREKNHLTWMRPIERATPVAGGDYYVLFIGDRDAVPTLGLKTLYKGAISATVLAVP